MTDIGLNTGDANTVGWVPENAPDKAYTFGKGTAKEIGTRIEQIEQAAIADGGVIRVDSDGYHMLKQLKRLMQEHTMASSVGSANPGQINVNGRTVTAESQRIIGDYVSILEDGGTVSVAQMADLFGVQWSLDVGLFANGSQITNTDLVFRDTTTPPPGNTAPSADNLPAVEIPERTPVHDSLVDRAQALLRDSLSADTVESKSVLYEQAMELLDQNIVNARPASEPITVPDAGIPQGTWDNLQSLEYIASHPDLMDAYGTDVGQAEVHFNSNGNDEGRRITFSAAEYLAANPDLQDAFGGNLGAAARHYIETGRNEDRMLAPPAPEPEPAPDTGAPGDTLDTGDVDAQLVLSDEMTRFLAELDTLEDLMQGGGQTEFYNDVVELTSLALETTRSKSEGGEATSFGEYEQLRAGLDDLYTDVLASADSLEDPGAPIDALTRALLQLTNLIATDS